MAETIPNFHEFMRGQMIELGFAEPGARITLRERTMFAYRLGVKETTVQRWLYHTRTYPVYFSGWLRLHKRGISIPPEYLNKTLRRRVEEHLGLEPVLSSPKTTGPWELFDKIPCGSLRSIKGICYGQGCYHEKCKLRAIPYRPYSGASRIVDKLGV
jgi:hypothetical protein